MASRNKEFHEYSRTTQWKIRRALETDTSSSSSDDEKSSEGRKCL